MNGPMAIRSLAQQLASEVATLGIEQSRVLMVNATTGQKCIVLVTTTDRATDILLDWIDGQVEAGVIRDLPDPAPFNLSDDEMGESWPK